MEEPEARVGSLKEREGTVTGERRSHSTEDLFRGESGGKKAWGYKKKSRHARPGTDNSIATSTPVERQYKSRQVETADPLKTNSTHSSGLSSFKLPLSPRLMNSFPLSPRVRLPRTALEKEDEEYKESDSVAAASSFQPNFRNEAKTLRLAVSKEVQKCARLQHTLHELREKQKTARRLHIHRGQLLEELSLLFRSPTSAAPDGRELQSDASSIIASLLQAHQEELPLYLERDSGEEDIDASLQCEDAIDCVDTSDGMNITDSGDVLGRKGADSLEGNKGNLKHHATSEDLLQGEQDDGSDIEEENSNLAEDLSSFSFIPDSSLGGAPLRHGGIESESSLLQSNGGALSASSTFPKGTTSSSEGYRGVVSSSLRSSVVDPSLRYERDAMQVSIPFKYPRQAARSATELPRVVPHIVRPLSENDNLRRCISFRHLLRHHNAALQLKTFLKERVQKNVEEELHHLLFSQRPDDYSTESSAQLSGAPLLASAPQKVPEKSYRKNYLAQKALREKRDKMKTPVAGTDEAVSPDEFVASVPDLDPSVRTQEGNDEGIGEPPNEAECMESDRRGICISVSEDDFASRPESESHPHGNSQTYGDEYCGLPSTLESPRLPEDEADSDQNEVGNSQSDFVITHLAPDSPNAQCKYFIERLVSSERSYVQNLETALSMFASLVTAEIAPCDPHSGFLKLFSQLELMVAINREFLLRLEQYGTGFDDIANCFLEMMPHLGIYRDYACTLKKLAVNIAYILQRPSQFRQQQDEVVKHLEEPLHRIFSYATLINGMVRTFVEDKRMLQASEKLRELSYNIGYIHLPSPQELTLRPRFAWPDREVTLNGQGRLLVRSGTFTKLSGKGEIIARKLLLFTDVCLVCHELRSRELLLRTIIPMHLALIIDNGETSNSFAVVRRDVNEGGVFNATSREEKERWIDDLNRVVLNRLLPT